MDPNLPPIPPKSASQLIKSQLNIPPSSRSKNRILAPQAEGSSVSALPWNSQRNESRISVRLLAATHAWLHAHDFMPPWCIKERREERRVSRQREEEIRQRFVNEKLVKRGRNRERERETGERLSRPSAASWNRYRDRARTREREKESGRTTKRSRSGGWSTERGERGTERADRGSWLRDEDGTRQAKERGCALEREVREGGREREMTTGRVRARATGSTRCTHRACVRGERGERTGGSLSTGAKYSLSHRREATRLSRRGFCSRSQIQARVDLSLSASFRPARIDAAFSDEWKSGRGPRGARPAHLCVGRFDEWGRQWPRGGAFRLARCSTFRFWQRGGGWRGVWGRGMRENARFWCWKEKEDVSRMRN